MEFKQLAASISRNMQQLEKSGRLFRSSVSGDQLWCAYIDSFISGDDPVFRDPQSSTHRGNLDNNFIRRYGNIVCIDAQTFQLKSIFDIAVPEISKYYEPLKAMTDLLHAAPVADIFTETFDSLNKLPYEKISRSTKLFTLGFEKTYKTYTQAEADKFGVVTAGKQYTFNHFFGVISDDYVDKSGASIESIMGNARSIKNVLKRGLDEISLDTLLLVRDLINQGSLLNGTAFLPKIDGFINLKTAYKSIPETLKDNWCWNALSSPFARFRNELIGTLCVELTEGKELNDACKTWNIRVDPVNYMKASAPITKRQIEEAQKFVEENGYAESFDRRFATIEDINIEEILHVGKTEDTKTASIFDKVKPTPSTQHKRSEFNGIEEVSIEKFMKDILPTCTSLEAYFENRFASNLVTMTTAKKSSKDIFKWNNPFSWTYEGNITGKSMLKDAVKAAGGKIEAVLRFSIMWNENGKDILDFDAHAVEPDHTEIYYGNYRGGSKTRMSGNLDVDMIRPHGVGVENITWSDKSKMKDGDYRMFINNFDNGRNSGFKAEVEFDGEIYSYEYNQPVGPDVDIAIVTLKDGKFTIKHCIPESGVSSKEIWGIDTNKFHKVNLVCLSPNHWGENNIGNKHYFFMIDGCHSETAVRSFHNENLCSELLEHRKVMEVLGASAMLEPTKKQLAGLGFNSTVRDELIVKVSGTHKRMLRIKF